MRRHREHEIIGETIRLLDQPGVWTTGTWEHDGRYCLVGAINHVQHRPAIRDSARTYSVVEALGFSCLKAAIRFNDRQDTVAPVLERLRATHRRLDPWRRLHAALDESRVAHAEREIGRGVPDGVPAAWVEEHEDVREKKVLA